MLTKYMAAAALGSTLLASVAFAQSPASNADRAAATSSAISEQSLQGNWRASKVVGLNVYNNNNEKVGDINDILMDKSGNIKAVVIGVGGFLGMGEHLVAIPLDKIKFVNEPMAYSGTASNSNSKAGAATSTTTTTGSASSTTSSKANPWYPDHAVFNATKDDLKAMPEFKYSS